MKTAPTFDKLVDELSRLPGVGPRTAARLAFFIVKQPEAWVETLAKTLLDVKRKIRFCSICGQTTEEDPCAICADPRRDSRVICVVEDARAVDDGLDREAEPVEALPVLRREAEHEPRDAEIAVADVPRRILRPRIAPERRRDCVDPVCL